MPSMHREAMTDLSPVSKDSEEHDSNENTNLFHVFSEVVLDGDTTRLNYAQTLESPTNASLADSLGTIPYQLTDTYSEQALDPLGKGALRNLSNTDTLPSPSHLSQDSNNYSSDSCYNMYKNPSHEMFLSTESGSPATHNTSPDPPTFDTSSHGSHIADNETFPTASGISSSTAPPPKSLSSNLNASLKTNTHRKSKATPPWYCITRPIHEQTRNIKISTANKSSSINRSRLLAKCHSMLEYCVSRVDNAELNANNIQELNYNHHWGDPLPKGVKGNTIRIVYQNVNKSLSATPNPATYSLLDLLKQMEADVFMASETNRNWRSSTFRNNLKQTVRRKWNSNRIAFSSSKIGDKFLSDEMLPGGTVTMVFDHLATRTVKIGDDEEEMGRLSYITVEGQGAQKLTFITGYQICKGAMKGTSTSCMQQKAVINEAEMKRGETTSNPSTEFLRTKFINDLIAIILQLQAEGHAIILALDANETPEACIQNGTVKPGSIEFLLQETGLKEVFQERHHQTPDSTTTTPGRFIDRMATWGVDVQRVTLLRANEPATSDHLAIVIDIDMSILFRSPCSSMEPPKCRKLTSGNQEAVNSYVSFIKKQFQNHKIIERCQQLREAMETNQFELKHQRRLYALDKQVTEILLGAENQCSSRKNDRNLWSPELDNAGTKIKYWRCRLKTNGHIDDSTYDLGTRLRIPSHQQQSMPIEECQKQLSIAWKNYRRIQQKARDLRYKHLKQRAEQHAAKGSGDVATSIKHLRKMERTKYDYQSIRRAYGINKQGLTTLDVPDQDTGGRLLITNKDEIHQYLLQRNKKHFSQATFTAFGDAGPGYKFINPEDPASDHHVDAMLEGVFEPWESASPHVRELIAELKCTVEEELDTKLHLSDFKSLFKAIPESTAKIGICHNSIFDNRYF